MLAPEERDIHQLIEQEVKGRVWLERADGSKVDIGEVTPVRRGFGTRKGRPDTVIWIDLRLPILGVNMRARYPALVEVGKAGFADAVVDFSSFCQTDQIEIPGLVVGGTKREQKEAKYNIGAKLNMEQLPFERIV